MKGFVCCSQYLEFSPITDRPIVEKATFVWHLSVWGGSDVDKLREVKQPLFWVFALCIGFWGLVSGPKDSCYS